MYATGSELYRGLGAELSGALMDLNLELDHCQRTLARFGEPVLDVGCGQGRILLALRGRGIDIDGCDLSLDMLAHAARAARQRGLAVNLYWQAMQDLELPRRYRTILVPSGGLMHLTEPAEAMEALRRLHDHLLPGGGLLLSVCLADVTDPLGAPIGTTGPRLEPGTDGALLRVDSSWMVHDPLNRVGQWHQEYRLERSGEVVRQEVRDGMLRSYTKMELSSMLAWNGYVDIEVLYPVERTNPSGDCLLLTARRRW
jgi:SAM-dependent methyltransferase